MREFTEDEIRMIRELAKEMREEANSDLPMEENMQISLAGRVENVDEQKEIAGICAGIRDFDDMMRQLAEEDPREVILRSLADSGLKDKTPEEQYTVLEGTLKTLTAELEKNPDYKAEVQVSADSDTAPDQVTDEALEQLKQKLAEYLDQFALMHGGEAVSEQLFAKLSATMGEDAFGALKDGLADDEQRYYMALSVYILRLQGKLESVPPEMDGHGIGAAVAAFIASARARMEGFFGKISWEDVLAMLKRIASAALTLLICTAIVVTAAKAAEFVFVLSAWIIGYGVIGTAIAAVLAVACGIKLADVLSDLKDDTARTLEELGSFAAEKYWIVRRWIAETAIPRLREFLDHLKYTVFHEEEACKEETEETCEEKAEEEECAAEEELDEELVVEA